MKDDGSTIEPTAIPGTIAALRDRYAFAVRKTTEEVVDEGRTPGKAEELAMVAARYADGEIDAWRGRPDSPKDIACRAGCSFCCHAPVAITIPEAILIANTLAAECDDEELAPVREKVERAHQARAGLVGKRRNQVRHPCPMLDDEGACSIYEFRPLNCRGWNSLDVSRCESSFDDPSRGVPIPIDGVQRTITEGMVAGMQGGLESRGLEHESVDFSAALHILLEDPTAIHRWLAGSPAFRDAEVPDAPPG